MREIACRELWLKPNRVVRVRIGVPEPDDGSSRCRWQILGIRNTADLTSAQVDSLGALLYAVEMAAVTLHATEECESGLVSWPLDPTDGTLGLPPELFGVDT